MNLTRRTLISGVSTGIAALGSLGLPLSPANAQLIDEHSDWKYAEFNSLLKVTSRAKQVYDVRPIADGKFLNNIKNSLNGFHFGFNIPVDQIKLIAAMHGPSNMLNFDDSMWEKYHLGEWLKIDDPRTGKPAIRNIYFPKRPAASTDPQSRASIFQDTSIEGLQGRGVKFLSCHTATEEQVHSLVEQFSLKTPAEEIVKDLETHTLPGVLIVPAMVATISVLQSEGHYTYITV